MLKKIFIIIFTIFIIVSYCHNSYATTYVQTWDNMASTYGSLVDFADLPVTLTDNDRYMFFYSHYWSSGHVNFNLEFLVVHNVGAGFYVTYEPSYNNQDGLFHFYNINGYHRYTYNKQTNSYNLSSSNSSVTSLDVGHSALLGYNAESIFNSAIPSTFLSNFNVLSSSDTSQVVCYKNINNSFLHFTNTETFMLGGNSNNNLVLENNYNYSVNYEPILYVYIGNNVSSQTLTNTVYLNSFKLNSGNFSIPYNRIFTDDISVGSKVFFLLSIPNENGQYNRSLFYSTMTGGITIDDYQPTEPSQPSTGNDYTENLNNIETSINNQTNAINNLTDSIMNQNTSDPTSIDIQDNITDNTANLSNFFNIIQSAFINRDFTDKTFSITLPNNRNFTFTFPKDFLRNFVLNNEALNAFVSAFWYIVFGVYIIFDMKKIYNLAKNGDFELALNSSPVDNIVKETLR